MDGNAAIEKKILEIAIERGPDKTTCPSDIARMMFPNDWRRHMEKVRCVAVELQRKGKVLITQKGKPIDIEHIKGPIRIKIS
ncbi:MAG: DUF3253 domain-containing protein [Pedobacter sp.]